MTNDNDTLAARVALRCLHLGLNPRKSHIGSLAGHIRQSIGHRETIADSDIDALLMTLAKTHKSHFGVDPTLSREQKLDLVNERAAKREESIRPDGKIELTEKEQKRLEKMTASQRLDFANARNAAAIEEAKKAKAVT